MLKIYRPWNVPNNCHKQLLKLKLPYGVIVGYYQEAREKLLDNWTILSLDPSKEEVYGWVLALQCTYTIRSKRSTVKTALMAYVKDSCRRKNVGSKLVNKAKKLVEEKDLPEVCAFCHDERSNEFWLRNGISPVRFNGFQQILKGT